MRSVLLVAISLSIAAISGCGGVSMVEVSEESRLLVAEAAARDRMLALREAALKRREKELAELETQVSDKEPADPNAPPQLALSSSDSSSECVAALFIPALLEKGPVEYQITPEYQVAEITPATFQHQEKLVYAGQKPANPNIVVDYRRHFEDVVILPAHNRSNPSAATLEKIKTTIQLKPEYLDWQPCDGNSAFCASKQQAQLTAIDQTVVSQPLRLNTQRVSPVIQQVEVKTPLQAENSIVGGYVEVYQPIAVQTLNQDEQVSLKTVASTSTTIEAWSLRQAARVELRPVICAEELAKNSDQASSLLGRLRDGLNEAGYSVKAVGEFDPKLKQALRSYQRDNGLALSDELPSIESLSALGAYP